MRRIVLGFLLVFSVSLVTNAQDLAYDYAPDIPQKQAEKL